MILLLMPPIIPLKKGDCKVVIESGSLKKIISNNNIFVLYSTDSPENSRCFCVTIVTIHSPFGTVNVTCENSIPNRILRWDFRR